MSFIRERFYTSGYRAFAVPIPLDTLVVTVTGLDLPLPAVADIVDVKVVMPSSTMPGARRITPHMVRRTTTDAATFVLSGKADVTGYTLVGCFWPETLLMEA